LLVLVQAAEERHAAAVCALKQGWAAELKRQAANWEAAAAAKQEAWRTAKVAEIKEQTVKVWHTQPAAWRSPTSISACSLLSPRSTDHYVACSTRLLCVLVLQKASAPRKKTGSCRLGQLVQS
jgi:hypothetical protein